MNPFGKPMKKMALLLATVLHLAGALLPAQEIFQALGRNDRNRVEEILTAEPSQVNARNRNGQTPLLFAVATRNIDLARLLLERGSLVNCGDNNLRAPIHYANWNNDKKMIELLLEHGAVIDTRAIGAATPLIHASLANQFAMSKFLIEKGADIDIQCNSLTTPFYFAVLNNNLEYMDYLIAAGAEVDVPDFLGRTPLWIAVRDGTIEAAKKLLQNGADPQRRELPTKRSLLHLAAIEGHAALIDLLLEKGADMNAHDAGGKTALDLALRYGNKSCARLLENRGAMPTTQPAEGAANLERAPGLKKGRAHIVKLQNGSWGVITQSSLLILGYSEIGSSADDPSLLNGHIPAAMLEGNRKVYCIDPDFHPVKERFSLTGSNPLLTEPRSREHIRFIFNSDYRERYEPYGLKRASFPKPGETLAWEGLTLRLLPSYERNLCYLIELDGLAIVWLTGICDNYLPHRRDVSVIQKLGQTGIRVDILFLGSPAGIGPEFARGISSTYIEAAVLDPQAVFVFGHELLERKVLGQITRRSKESPKVRIAENPGDLFVFPLE